MYTQIVGLPINIVNEKYTRNSYFFNIGFLFPVDSCSTMYDHALCSLGLWLEKLENETNILVGSQLVSLKSTPDIAEKCEIQKREIIYKLLLQIYNELQPPKYSTVVVVPPYLPLLLRVHTLHERYFFPLAGLPTHHTTDVTIDFDDTSNKTYLYGDIRRNYRKLHVHKSLLVPVILWDSQRWPLNGYTDDIIPSINILLQFYYDTLQDIFLQQVIECIDGIRNIQSIVIQLHSTLEFVLQALSIAEVAGIVALIYPISDTSIFNYGTNYINAIKSSKFISHLMRYSVYNNNTANKIPDITKKYYPNDNILICSIINSIVTNQILPLSIITPGIKDISCNKMISNTTKYYIPVDSPFISMNEYNNNFKLLHLQLQSYSIPIYLYKFTQFLLYHGVLEPVLECPYKITPVIDQSAIPLLKRQEIEQIYDDTTTDENDSDDSDIETRE